jgi:putative spermidine/putrescine transport system substrate-binding protein
MKIFRTTHGGVFGGNGWIFISLTAVFLLFICLYGCFEERDSPGAALLSMGYTDIAEQAKGTIVHFYMDDSDSFANKWVDTVLCPFMKRRYDISVVRVPVVLDAFAREVVASRDRGDSHGSADLVGVYGRNFRNLKQAGALFGPYAEKLPNYLFFVNKDMAGIDFGMPVDGYETPFGMSRFVFEYDADRMNEPPRTMEQLRQWIKDNPGRFTYCAPPNPIGAAFIRQVLFAVSGGADQYYRIFDRKLLERNVPLLWDYLEDIRPFMWKKGNEYPESRAHMDGLFASGEIWLNMSYRPLHASSMVLAGEYPMSVRSYAMEDGALFHLHCVAIPFDAPNKGGAMVLANVLMSPEVQYSKLGPVLWGDLPGIDVSRLPGSICDRFSSVYLGRAAASHHDLAVAAIPEISAEYENDLEQGWKYHFEP